MQYIILPVLFLLMYVLVIRPQQQRVRSQQAVVSALKVGDEVISNAGIYGHITELTDQTALLEVAPGVVLKLARQAIVRMAPAEVIEDSTVPVEDQLNDPTTNTDENGI